MFIGDCIPLLYSMCVCVKQKFQFVTGGNWESSKRHASLYSIVFGSLKSLPCIFCTNQTIQNVTFKRKSLRTTTVTTTKNFSTLKYTFLIQTGLIVFVFFFFCPLNSLFQVEVFEAIQHILTSRAGWKFQSVSTYY